MKIGKYEVSFRRGALVHGRRGYDFDIYEPGRASPVRTGWTAGNRRDAEQEAARAIRELEARNNNACLSG